MNVDIKNFMHIDLRSGYTVCINSVVSKYLYLLQMW